MMEERLKQIKELVTAFIRDYNIKEFWVDIDDGINISSFNDPKKEIEVEIKLTV